MTKTQKYLYGMQTRQGVFSSDGWKYDMIGGTKLKSKILS